MYTYTLSLFFFFTAAAYTVDEKVLLQNECVRQVFQTDLPQMKIEWCVALSDISSFINVKN